MSREGTDPRGATPGVDAGKTRLQKWVHWLKPTMEEEGRVGFLSTYEEVHSFFFGIMVGLTLGSGGLIQYLSSILGAGVAGSRYQKGLPDSYQTQIKRELPHFVAGIIIAYVFTTGVI